MQKHSAVRNSRAQAEDVFSAARASSDEEVLEIADLLWKDLNTPMSLGLHLLYKAGQYEDLLRVDFDPTRYLDSDVDLAANDHQAISFLRKCPLDSVVGAAAREEAAWVKFEAAEEQCRQTNARFRARLRGEYSTPAVECILHSAQQKIAGWLGKLDARSWALRCRFGPGADNLTTGQCVSAYHKLSELSSTDDFADGAVRLASDHPPWNRYLNGIHPVDGHGPTGAIDIIVVPGNKITFVPKTALTDRSIAIEPRMNIFAQLGLGALIRQRLKKRAGLDLDTQVPSQELALQGSIFGTVATIDLSSASDTLAREVVRDLIPLPWLTALEWVRSKSGTYRGKKICYEKFSSMGNGYTFELESMIFYALALACAEYCRDDTSVVRVFGDDIAYPTRSVDLLVEVLTYCGFTANPRKSFSRGVFRESCGADYFNGRNVRPFLLEENLKSVEALFRLANGIRRAACRRNLGFGYDGRYRRAWITVVQRIPSSLRGIRGPWRLIAGAPHFDVECDDGYIASDFDEAMTSKYVHKARSHFEGFHFPRFEARSKTVVGLDDAMNYLFALYSFRDGASDKAVLGKEIKRSFTPFCPNGAPLITTRGSQRRRRLSVKGLSPNWPSYGAWS